MVADEPGNDTGGYLRVTSACRIPLGELEWFVSRSSGPGGQHANTADTRVEVRFAVDRSTVLGPRQRARLLERIGPVVSATAQDSRSQARNRALALERLRSRLAEGLRVVPDRRATRPSRSAQTARIDRKRRHGDLKRGRARPEIDD
jgi:ribosome-associated protein